MLLLSRKKHEAIVIARGITISVLDCVGNRVRLGISTPAAVKTIRNELIADQPRSPIAEPASHA
jgi:carbon storage regulator CsrA